MSVRIGLCALVAALTLPGLPASAATVGVEEAAVDGIVALQAEVMLLVELDAFAEPIPDPLMDVYDEWASYMEGFGRSGLADWLVEVDGDGADALGRLVAAGVDPSPELRTALARLSPETASALESGTPVTLDPLPYVVALDQLSQQDFAAPTGEPTPTTQPTVVSISTTSTVTAEPTTTTVTTAPITVAATNPVTESADRVPEAGSNTLRMFLVALGAAVLAPVGIASWRRRRPRPHGFDHLLDAGRRMTRALDRAEIAHIARTEAMRLADAPHGAFIHVDGDHMELADASDEIFDVRRLSDGILQRIADTGQPSNVVVRDEPAITALPAALLGVPVIGGGRVAGIIMLVRPDHRPFGRDEEQLLARLAPMVGSAMAAAARHDDVTALSLVDPLTGLPNRRALDRDLVAATTSPDMLAVAMIDVDHFKRFNDTNGHGAGDTALATVGEILSMAVRDTDRAYRYGGEEFSLVLRVPDVEEARRIAERIRAAVEAAKVPGADRQPDGRLTVSVGVALVTGPDPASALAAADAALYSAKKGGRNRVVVVDPVTV